MWKQHMNTTNWRKPLPPSHWLRPQTLHCDEVLHYHWIQMLSQGVIISMVCSPTLLKKSFSGAAGEFLVTTPQVATGLSRKCGHALSASPLRHFELMMSYPKMRGKK